MKKEPELKDISRIAIFRTDRIGEVILATALIEALRKNLPLAKISFITSSYARDIVSERRDLEEVMTFDTIGRKVSFWRTIFLSFKLRSRRFDTAIILNPHKALHLAVFSAGIKHRVGFDRKLGFLLNRKLKDERDRGAMHELNYGLELLEAIGIREKDIAPFLDVPDIYSDYIRDLFKQLGASLDKKTVVMHPGSSNPAKQWPWNNYAQLIKRLNADNSFNIILTGDENERPLCEKIAAVADNAVFNFAGILTLKQLAALLKEADLMITNDNGPMHMAAAVGTRVIAIFGRNIPGVSPKRWGPYGEGHLVFHKDPGCIPCYDKDCPHDFKCLTETTAKEVFEAAKRVLNEQYASNGKPAQSGK